MQASGLVPWKPFHVLHDGEAVAGETEGSVATEGAVAQANSPIVKGADLHRAIVELVRTRNLYGVARVM